MCRWIVSGYNLSTQDGTLLALRYTESSDITPWGQPHAVESRSSISKRGGYLFLWPTFVVARRHSRPLSSVLLNTPQSMFMVEPTPRRMPQECLEAFIARLLLIYLLHIERILDDKHTTSAANVNSHVGPPIPMRSAIILRTLPLPIANAESAASIASAAATATTFSPAFCHL